MFWEGGNEVPGDGLGRVTGLGLSGKPAQVAPRAPVTLTVQGRVGD